MAVRLYKKNFFQLVVRVNKSFMIENKETLRICYISKNGRNSKSGAKGGSQDI